MILLQHYFFMDPKITEDVKLKLVIKKYSYSILVLVLFVSLSFIAACDQRESSRISGIAPLQCWRQVSQPLGTSVAGSFWSWQSGTRSERAVPPARGWSAPGSRLPRSVGIVISGAVSQIASRALWRYWKGSMRMMSI